MHFLPIFLHLCVDIVIPNIHVKDHFNWPSRISPRVMWICLSFRLNSVKTTILLFLGFLKIKNSRANFRLIFENSLPKGFSCQSMKKSVISVLKINSRYLQSSGLKGKQRCAFIFRNVLMFHSQYQSVSTVILRLRIFEINLCNKHFVYRACYIRAKTMVSNLKVNLETNFVLDLILLDCRLRLLEYFFWTIS